MIYSRGIFAFVHIPRTAGMSITTSLAHAMSLSPCHFAESVIATYSEPESGERWYRHARAAEIRGRIADWGELKRFAVYRPIDEIIESDYRLHRSYDEGDTMLPQSFRESITLAKTETLEEFTRRRWHPWLEGSDPWDYWAGPAFRRFEFATIQDDWPELLDWLGLPQVPLIHVNAA